MIVECVSTLCVFVYTAREVRFFLGECQVWLLGRWRPRVVAELPAALGAAFCFCLFYYKLSRLLVSFVCCLGYA